MRLSRCPFILYEESLADWRNVELQVVKQSGVRTENNAGQLQSLDRVHWVRYARRDGVLGAFGRRVVLPSEFMASLNKQSQREEIAEFTSDPKASETRDNIAFCTRVPPCITLCVWNHLRSDAMHSHGF